MCSEAARPCAIGLRAVLGVPRKPHVGLSSELVPEGSQLHARSRDLPPRLPARLPVEGSKSSRAKVERRLAQ
eukprot:4065804-Pyramimonas_sp.AAC.1